MELRAYQRAAVEAVRESEHKSTLCVLPTGAGKSLVLSELAAGVVESGGRALIVTHRAELLRQSQRTLSKMHPGVATSLYGASLGAKDLSGSTVLSMVQTLGRDGTLSGLDESVKRFDMLLVDEAHRVPPMSVGDADEMQYHRVVRGVRETNPDCKLVGLTATPYRVGQGYLWSGGAALFDGVAYEKPVGELIAEGYLVPPVAYNGAGAKELSSVRKQKGEYDVGAQHQLISSGTLADEIVDSIIMKGRKQRRRKWMVFVPLVKTARLFTKLLEDRGVNAAYITQTTSEEARQQLYARFRDLNDPLQALCGVNVLSEGFDAAPVDLIALVRATTSPGLYVQVVGRGLRLCDGKDSCLILDHGKNVERHGPIDDIDPERVSSRDRERSCMVCKECEMIIPERPADGLCPGCGAELPKPKPRKDPEASASKLAILGGQAALPVDNYEWAVYPGKDGGSDRLALKLWITWGEDVPEQYEEHANGKPVMRWYSPDHEHWANQVLALRADGVRGPVPTDAAGAASEAKSGEWRVPTEVRLRPPEGKSTWARVRRISWSEPEPVSKPEPKNPSGFKTLHGYYPEVDVGEHDPGGVMAKVLLWRHSQGLESHIGPEEAEYLGYKEGHPLHRYASDERVDLRVDDV